MSKLDDIIKDITTNAKFNKDGPAPQPIEMHLDSLESVRKGVEDFKSKSGNKLDILIGNAGVMAAPYGQTKDGFETQIGVNHMSHFLLFQLLKPLLLESAAKSGITSRVVLLSSAGHRTSPVLFSDKAGLDSWNKGENFEKWKSYGQSKTANIWMANEISTQVES
jgi:NAD(P)-dependent dehydrogenase (short-subunit alcohol dehydrogenase family)